MSASAEQWRDLGKALMDNAEVLEMLSEQEDDGLLIDEPKRTLIFLIRHGLIDGDQLKGYLPNPILFDIDAALSMEEVRRRIVPDIEEWYSDLELEIERYNVALIRCNEQEQRRQLQSIRQLALRMRSAVSQEISSIQFFLRTKFGHVKGVEQKRKENQFLIARTVRLSNKLVFINLEKLSRLTQNNSTLIRILLINFMPDIEGYREQLLALIVSLEKLMWEFRQHSLRSKQLWALSRHLQHGESVLSQEPANDHWLETPFNLLLKESQQALPDVHEPSCQSALIELVKQLPVRKVDCLPNQKLLVSEYQNDEAEKVEIDISPLLDHRRQFIHKAYSEKLSASGYWSNHGIPDIPYIVWLQWLYVELRNAKAPMELSYEPPAEFDGNLRISDLRLLPRKA